MARETSCLSRVAAAAGTAMDGALGGVVGGIFGIYKPPTIFKVPGGWAYEATVIRLDNNVWWGRIRLPKPSCFPSYTLKTISIKFVPCKVSC